jgi:hypothetical protein
LVSANGNGFTVLHTFSGGSDGALANKDLWLATATFAETFTGSNSLRSCGGLWI